MNKYSEDIILWYNKPFTITLDNCITNLSTPKKYGQKLLNRKQGRK